MKIGTHCLVAWWIQSTQWQYLLRISNYWAGMLREMRTKASNSESFEGKMGLLQYIQCSEAQMPLHEVVRVPPPGYHREVNATYWREISSTDHIHPQWHSISHQLFCDQEAERTFWGCAKKKLPAVALLKLRNPFNHSRLQKPASGLRNSTLVRFSNSKRVRLKEKAENSHVKSALREILIGSKNVKFRTLGCYWF